MQFCPAFGRGLLTHPLAQVISSGALVYTVVGPAETPGVVLGVFLCDTARTHAR